MRLFEFRDQSRTFWQTIQCSPAAAGLDAGAGQMLRNEDYGFTKVAYTVNETLGLLSIGRTQLYEQVKNGRLKATKVGRKTIFVSYDIAAFLDSVRADAAR